MFKSWFVFPKIFSFKSGELEQMSKSELLGPKIDSTYFHQGFPLEKSLAL